MPKMERTMRIGIMAACLTFLFGTATAQEQWVPVFIDGKVYRGLILDGDTTIIHTLDSVIITQTRTFASAEEKALYYRYLRNAKKVYPYAIEAIRIFREMEEVTKDLKRRDRKRYIKKLQDDLEREFEEPLKNLSKNQGMILVKMIERERQRSMYDMVSELRGGFTAFYWNSFSYFYGYRLKRPYTVGDDPILDMVLKDFNISYDIDNPSFKLPENYRAAPGTAPAATAKKKK